MTEENKTPEMVVVDIPSEYADKGFLSSVKTEDGKIDVMKLLKKTENQESALGKRALPTKDSSEEEIADFIQKMKTNFAEADYDSLFENVSDVKELKSVLKESGLTTNQAKSVVEAYKKDMEQSYSADEFAAEIAKITNIDKAKAVMTEEDWNTAMELKNKDSLKLIKAMAGVGERYAVKETTVGAGEPSGNKDFGKMGMCPEYVAEMKEARSSGASQAEMDKIMTKYGYDHSIGAFKS